jgi:hypothetical protein
MGTRTDSFSQSRVVGLGGCKTWVWARVSLPSFSRFMGSDVWHFSTALFAATIFSRAAFMKRFGIPSLFRKGPFTHRPLHGILIAAPVA